MASRYLRLTPGDRTFNVFNALLLLAVSFGCFYPFIYMIMRSLSGGKTYGILLFFPINLTRVNYDVMIYQLDFMKGLPISVARTVIGPIVAVLVNFMAGFSLARRNLLGRKFFSWFFIATMYLSAGLLPSYLNVVNMGLRNTFAVYIVLGAASVFHIILIRTFIELMPEGLQESAYVDGANDLQIAFRIVFPLSLPILAALIFFNAIAQWNAFTDTLLYNNMSPHLFTLQFYLSNFLNRITTVSPTDFQTPTEYQNFDLDALRMAMSVIVCIPIVCIYPFLQKYFIKGLLIGSIKG